MKLARLLPAKTVYAHCDLPCGVYDPVQAMVEAKSVFAIQTKMKDNQDPDFRARYSDLALRQLLADAEALALALATAVASDDPKVFGALAEQLSPRYRKRHVPLDDVILLCEGLRFGAAATTSPAARASIDAAVDAAAAALRWHRRLGGDARKRNAFIAFIYKGA